MACTDPGGESIDQRDRVTVRQASLQDVSPSLLMLAAREYSRPPYSNAKASRASADAGTSIDPSLRVAMEVEQSEHGAKPPAELLTGFDGLGFGFEGPQGTAPFRNPSDNTLAVGPDHIVQIVNSMTAVFSKNGKVFNTTGRPLYGPVETRNFFRGFGGPCEEWNNGDAVVRYDQLADRWLIVMPVFQRRLRQENEPARPLSGRSVSESQIGQPRQPGRASALYRPGRSTPEEVSAAASAQRQARSAARTHEGSYAMCYAVSTSPDPLGSYYRYEFVRPLFPDYPRPAVWPDGYYLPTSTGDDVIEKHACVADRLSMLLGESATEQCFVLDDVNFLNNADLDGLQLPPDGAPNIMMATGGTQLKGVFGDDGIYVWKFHVDWENPERTRLDGPEKIEVAPYAYLCDGQLTECVPQPGTDQRLDSQGDKIMSRLVYRRLGSQESIVAAHSVATTLGGGGVRWYEFRLDEERNVQLHQQGTLAPDAAYRWMPSPAMDAVGNIGIGYSFGSASEFAGQRFAARLAEDPPGLLTLHEAVLIHGQAPQTNTLRWEDYTQTAVDPSDDCTIWYVGDYVKAASTSYSTRIGAFLMPGCKGY